MPRQPIFFYGSLRDETLLSIVLGRRPEEVALEPAFLPDHGVRAVAGESFPCIVASAGEAAEGALLRDGTPEEAARVIFFEDEAEYVVREVAVRTPQGEDVGALVCFPRGSTTPDGPWRFEDWDPAEREVLMEAAREIMALHERGVDWSDLSLWPGIKARAASRASARRASGPPPFPAAPFRRDQVRTGEVGRPYASFFAVEEHHVSYPMSGGRMSEMVRRAVWIPGDAVTVLPYDARRDEVLLASQWRTGPHARGDAHPWPVEVVAGRLEGLEDPEDAARREAREEAGLELGRIEQVAAFYSSPGTVTEFVTCFAAEADLSRAGGAGGLESEAEDVISAVLPFNEAMEMIERGAVNTSPALISLLWLARQRERLRDEWRGIDARRATG